MPRIEAPSLKLVRQPIFCWRAQNLATFQGLKFQDLLDPGFITYRAGFPSAGWENPWNMDQISLQWP